MVCSELQVAFCDPRRSTCWPAYFLAAADVPRRLLPACQTDWAGWNCWSRMARIHCWKGSINVNDCMSNVNVIEGAHVFSWGGSIAENCGFRWLGSVDGVFGVCGSFLAPRPLGPNGIAFNRLISCSLPPYLQWTHPWLDHQSIMPLWHKELNC